MNPIRKQRYQSVTELFENNDNTVFDTHSEDSIDSVLNKEHAYTKEFIEHYGISIFSFIADGRCQIYYRGKVYNGDKIKTSLRSLADTAFFLDDAKYDIENKGNSIDIDTYINGNKHFLSTAYNVITYCNEHDLLNIQLTIKRKPFLFETYRVVQEMQLIPLFFDSFKDARYSYEYQHQYCETEYGGGVVEVLQSGFIDQKKDYTLETIIKKLSNFEGFAYLTLGAIIYYCILNKKWQDDTVLLCAFPFYIKVEIWISGRYRDGIDLIERNRLIPCRLSETIIDDNCSIVIVFMGKRFALNIYDLFCYNPKSFLITVDVDANTNIKFILEDKEMRKEISLSFCDLLSYEVEK